MGQVSRRPQPGRLGRRRRDPHESRVKAIIQFLERENRGPATYSQIWRRVAPHRDGRGPRSGTRKALEKWQQVTTQRALRFLLRSGEIHRGSPKGYTTAAIEDLPSALLPRALDVSVYPVTQLLSENLSDLLMDRKLRSAKVERLRRPNRSPDPATGGSNQAAIRALLGVEFSAAGGMSLGLDLGRWLRRIDNALEDRRREFGLPAMVTGPEPTLALRYRAPRIITLLLAGYLSPEMTAILATAGLKQPYPPWTEPPNARELERQLKAQWISHSTGSDEDRGQEGAADPEFSQDDLEATVRNLRAVAQLQPLIWRYLVDLVFESLGYVPAGRPKQAWPISEPNEVVATAIETGSE